MSDRTTAYVGYIPFGVRPGDGPLTERTARRVNDEARAFMSRTVPLMAKQAGILLEPPFTFSETTQECLLAEAPSRTAYTFDPDLSWVVYPVPMTVDLAWNAVMLAKAVNGTRVVVAAPWFEDGAVQALLAGAWGMSAVAAMVMREAGGELGFTPLL